MRELTTLSAKILSFNLLKLIKLLLLVGNKKKYLAVTSKLQLLYLIAHKKEKVVSCTPKLIDFSEFKIIFFFWIDIDWTLIKLSHFTFYFLIFCFCSKVYVTKHISLIIFIIFSLQLRSNCATPHLYGKNNIIKCIFIIPSQIYHYKSNFIQFNYSFN